MFSRLLFGARVSLGLAVVAALGALVLGASVGGLAGYAGGPADDVLMRAADFVLVLPAMYVALALRSVLPLVLAPRVVFLLLAGIFAIVGAPFFARGVRAIVRSERRLDYAVAATSLGASHARVLARHLLPAARGFMVVQITMLVPAFIIAEATLSFVGLGFPDPTASWGTMLHDASNVRVFADFPWLLSPAAAMFLVVLALNLVLERIEHDWSASSRAYAKRVRYERARIVRTDRHRRTIEVDGSQSRRAAQPAAGSPPAAAAGFACLCYIYLDAAGCPAAQDGESDDHGVHGAARARGAREGARSRGASSSG